MQVVIQMLSHQTHQIVQQTLHFGLILTRESEAVELLLTAGETYAKIVLLMRRNNIQAVGRLLESLNIVTYSREGV